MSEIKMLPLPTRLAASGLKSDIVNFAERLAEHNVAARDAEIEALRLDAKRYRWLRAPERMEDTCYLCGYDAFYLKTGDELDAAIDAAREARNG